MASGKLLRTQHSLGAAMMPGQQSALLSCAVLSRLRGWVGHSHCIWSLQDTQDLACLWTQLAME